MPILEREKSLLDRLDLARIEAKLPVPNLGTYPRAIRDNLPMTRHTL